MPCRYVSAKHKLSHHLIPAAARGLPQQAETLAMKTAHEHLVGEIRRQLIELLLVDRARQRDMRTVSAALQLERIQYPAVQFFHRPGIRYVHIEHMLRIPLPAMIDAGSIYRESRLVR